MRAGVVLRQIGREGAREIDGWSVGDGGAGWKRRRCEVRVIAAGE